MTHIDVAISSHKQWLPKKKKKQNKNQLMKPKGKEMSVKS